MEPIYGVFDGRSMIADNGQEYPVNVNYISKSKLLEGDGLRLDIQPDNSFRFKQIQPIERHKVAAMVDMYNGIACAVLPDGHRYKINQSTAYYFKLKNYDKISISVPADGQGEFCAVENVVPNVDAEL